MTIQTLDLDINSSQETSYNNSQPKIGNIRSATDSIITSIFNITTKKQRYELMLNSIPGWIETNSVLEFNNEKAQKGHKSVFEMLVLDLLPWSTFNNPGFLRHRARMVPNFELASEKYYRDMLEPTYNKILTQLKHNLYSDNPTQVAISLDCWSAYHHGYMGIVIHYIFKLSRKVFTLACRPFDGHHTAENIYSRLESTLLDWNIMDKVCVCLRDNAANMKAAFNVPTCSLSSAIV